MESNTSDYENNDDIKNVRLTKNVYILDSFSIIFRCTFRNNISIITILRIEYVIDKY